MMVFLFVFMIRIVFVMTMTMLALLFVLLRYSWIERLARRAVQRLVAPPIPC
jgi:hypothetical protein